MGDTERERFLAAVREGLANDETGRVVDDEEIDAFLDEQFDPLDLEAIYSILEERFDSEETDVAARHNEHQP